MITIQKRLLVTTILGVLALGLLAASAFAGLTITSNVTKATANSVWDIKAVWQDNDGLWPLYMPSNESEYNVQPDPGFTRTIRPSTSTQVYEPDYEEYDVDDGLRGVFIGYNGVGDPSDSLRATPISATTITGPTGTVWNVPANMPDITAPLNGDGDYEQLYIPAHTITGIDINGNPDSMDIPAVIVPKYGVVEGYVRADYGEVGPAVYSAQWARNVSPLWPYTVYVVVLGDNPNTLPIENAPTPAEARRVFIRYNYEDTLPETATIHVRSDAPIFPDTDPLNPVLPRPYVYYPIPLTRSLDGSVKLKINTGILQLDPNRTNPNDADPKFPTRPGLNSPLLGVYDTQNPDETDTNYFTPGQYSSNGRYGIINIPANRVPLLSGVSTDWVDEKILYVKVSTFAVDAVRLLPNESTNPQFPRRINYFRQPEWITGLASAWPGSTTAFKVTPDKTPRELRMKAVTGIYLPQIMSGTKIDDTHIRPLDYTRIRSVLAVYALKSITNGAGNDAVVLPLDDTHVISNPAYQTKWNEMDFVSAVYGIRNMPGRVIDRRHVSPEIPSQIYRLRSLKVAGSATEYYKPNATEQFDSQTDTEIFLASDLPLGVTTVNIEYETPNLYDPDNPELKFTEGDQIISLNNPIPADALVCRVVYGVGTGLDGVNLYDPNDASTAYRSGEKEIVLKAPGITDKNINDVRILYATDTVMETRGAMVNSTTLTTPNIWSIGQVLKAYAIREMEALTVDNMRVAPLDASLIRNVLGVYPLKKITYNIATSPSVIDGNNRLHILPLRPSSIRSVRAVRATCSVLGTRDANDRLVNIPGSAVVERILGVYRDSTKAGGTYFNPDNPETAYRPGDSQIRLSKPITAAAPYIEYETINLYTTNVNQQFRQGDTDVELDIALPANVISIDLTYIDIANLYNPNDPVNRYVTGNTQIILDSPVPAGTIETVISYSEMTNRYHAPIDWNYWTSDVSGYWFNPNSGIWINGRIAPNPIDTFEPGEDNIPLNWLPLPADSNGAIIVYNANLFREDYDPSLWRPDISNNNPVAAQDARRPFIADIDTYIRLNKIDTLGVNRGLPDRFTGIGSAKLCIAYQSDQKVEMGTYTTGGQLFTPVPLPMHRFRWEDRDNDLTTPVSLYWRYDNTTYLDYRLLTSCGPLWRVDGSLKEDVNKRSRVMATYTVGRPYQGYVWDTSQNWDNPSEHPLPDPLYPIDGIGKFRFPSYPTTQALDVTYRRQEPDSQDGVVWLQGVGGRGIGGKYRGVIPMYFDPRGGYNPKAGVVYRVAVSAGLNMSNPKQQPSMNLEENRSSWNNNRLIFDPRFNPMWYASGMKSEGGGDPFTGDLHAIGHYININIGLAFYANPDHAPDVTIHDSRPKYADEMIDHGGSSGKIKDWVAGYQNILPNIDPLTLEPLEEINPAYQDDGSSSTQFVFRIRYTNEDGLPPLPWLNWYDDPLCSGRKESGVVLYLDEKGTGDYQPHFMSPEDPEKPGSKNTYIYRMIPHHAFRIFADNDPAGYPWNDNNWSYQSLATGVYHYFFACSDDHLKFDGALDAVNNYVFDYQPNPLEWGDYPFWTGTTSSTALDPSLERSVTDYGEIRRPAKRRYSTHADIPYDDTLYVDRPLWVPGVFGGGGYPLSSDIHPKVTCSLGMPVADDLSIPYDDEKYGYGRFFGTLYPHDWMFNPSYIPTTMGALLIADSSGSTTQTDNVFRILYKQVDNEAPINISVLINNSYEKSGNTAAHKYTTYAMYPRTDQTQPYDYRTGVWYEFKTKLPSGPHTYYFQAYDGHHIARFPVRPDLYEYDPDPAPKGFYVDAWLPTGSKATDRGKAGYWDNDFFPGPYVNNAPVLSEATVTPGTGKEGSSFKYRIKYTDADGQGVHNAYIWIEYNNSGAKRRFGMLPETPLPDPADEDPANPLAKYKIAAAKIKQGVYYVLDTSTIKDFALENGVRRYYFEFTDDWGDPYDDNNDPEEDAGETVRYPAGADNWQTGPVISGNNPPTLTKGSVESQDGTANSGTLWTYRVTYRDKDHGDKDDKPTVTVYLGLLQPDGKTIIWDDGHAMLQTSPGDTVFSDGAEFNYQTRLGAADESTLQTEKQYFYAFEAYDGVDWATYRSSADEELKSDAAGCFLMQDLVKDSLTDFRIRPLIVQQGGVTAARTVTPDNWEDLKIKLDDGTIEYRVEGIYTNEDLTGPNYYEDILVDQKKIAVASTFPSNKDRVWIRYEAQSPIVGPLPIDLPAPAGVIPDALIFENFSSTPIPILIDDQKNGWINEDEGASPDDKATLMMRGLAIFESKASNRWVTPDNPRDIASVEGVYLTPEPTEDDTNYYEADQLEPPIWQKISGSQYDATTKTIELTDSDNPDRILKVMGVYTAKDINTTNYFLGEGFPDNVSWQEALLMGTNIVQWQGMAILAGSNTVWAKNPVDIVSIQGVYLEQDTSKTNYYRADGKSLQRAGAPFGLMVQPSQPESIVQVLGVYLSQDDKGINYYDSSNPYVSGDLFVKVKSTMRPQAVAYIQYSNGVDKVFQSAVVYVNAVTPVDAMSIKTVDGVFQNTTVSADGKPSGQGRNYYEPASANPAFKVGDEMITLTTPIPYTSLGVGGVTYVIYTNRGFGYGPENEYLALSRDISLDIDTTMPRLVYIAYYPRGTVQTNDTEKFVNVTTALLNGTNDIYLHILPRTFNCGDRVIPLTKDLPVEWMDAKVVEPYLVGPASVDAFRIVGDIIGVHTTQDSTSTNYYAKVNNPFKVGDTAAHLKTPLTVGTAVKLAYLPLKRNVYIDYSDIRFTHQLRGGASQPNPWYYWYIDTFWVLGSSHYTPDGWTTDIDPDLDVMTANVHIKNNKKDITGGVIGVWANNDRDGTNSFNPREAARHNDDPLHLRLTTPSSDGVATLWARYYQRGDYHINRWSRKINFLGAGKSDDSKIKASYFFGTKMPQTLKANTPPQLLKIDARKQAVTPLSGARNGQYTYTIMYKDTDGPNGQAPAYVRVYIDNQPFDMVPVNAGTPSYSDGAVYTYTPANLGGGEHSYRFEASDGVSMVYFDQFDNTGQPHPASGAITDMNGPWVNSPPELTGGAANPNPVNGTVSAVESIDYTVTYTDGDGDAPYFFDLTRDINLASGLPVGENVSGSPRLWIDSGTEDVSVAGTVQILLEDPLEPGKYRKIVAKGNPGWSSDQFAGKLMQITNGVGAGRVYLIQSNTSNTLVIATDNLGPGGDNIPDGSSAQAAKFIINGLLMSPANTTTPDYRQGVLYKVTVPRLTVGSHKFHFTARSREDKPKWLRDLEVALGLPWVPYSVESRDPVIDDYVGPTVVNTPPLGNSAPVLSTSAETSMYNGPQVLRAQVVTGTTNAITAAEGPAGYPFSQVREVLGVYMNANLSGTKYTSTNVSNTRIDLSADLVANVGNSLVQIGKPSGSSLLKVVPDVLGAINTVSGVYTTDDPTLQGTNYYVDLTAGKTGSISNGKINLAKPLPSGTEKVYIQYALKGGLQTAPVYVNHYSMHRADTVFASSNAITFRTNYRDADNDVPTYHAGVQGFVKIVFNGTGISKLMAPVTTPVLDYKVNVPFTVELTDVPEGTYKYHFEASDGYQTVRFPQGTLVDPTANDYRITVNYRPVLSAGDVQPPSGQSGTLFSFSVIYKDNDALEPLTGGIVARVTKVENPTEEFAPFTLSVDPAQTQRDYIKGVRYIGTTPVDSPLTPGHYNVMFEASDRYPQQALPLAGPQITVRNSNNVPKVWSYLVTPTAGKIKQRFAFTTKYRDMDNDPPIATINSERQEGLKLIVTHKGTNKTQEFIMTRVSSTPADYTLASGEEFKAEVDGNKFSVNGNTYEIRGYDGIANAVDRDTAKAPVAIDGPVLTVPQFDVIVTKHGQPVGETAKVGDQVLIVAKMRFPYNLVTGDPGEIQQLSITLTKPDRSILTLDGKVEETRLSSNGKNWEGIVTVDYKGDGVDAAVRTGDSLTLTASGEWRISVNWPGNNVWDKAETDPDNPVRLVVGYPMRTVAVDRPSDPENGRPLLDMITPPMVIGSPNVGQIFGFDRALMMQVIRWDPRVSNYFRYGPVGPFPDLQPGDAVWIRPRADYPIEPIYAEDAKQGWLSFGNAGIPNYNEQQRVIKVFANDYPTSAAGVRLPCNISLKTGWNQFGNIFFNWRTNAAGAKEDVGIPISELKVRYLNEEKSIAEANAAGWVRDYAWLYDTAANKYVPVHASIGGAERVLKVWRGYWIRAFVDCELIINPNTTYSGGLSAISSGLAREEAVIQKLDAPPAIPR